ncbi:PREDICTED: collagen alpha-1(XII) chain-like [Poecilia mexicana]|uniref:collagen alpha-1(XII) chain-like n=1 Tax=Poecilia mexicana TaxID=48701 RepID=UPI00072E0A38|nr:PREDICTED: collagen alpha-1(XII) chain-like [Poecilia mexicana]
MDLQTHFSLLNMNQLLVLLLLSSGLQGGEIYSYTGSQCEMTKADIVMLVDGSGSISQDDFGRMKSFLSEMVQNFPISPNKVQIGLTQFSSSPKAEWHLNSHNNKQSLLQAIDQIRQVGGGTGTGKALDYIRNHSFKPGVGMRPDSKKIVVLITDGEAQDKVGIPAKNLKDTGVEVFVIGVGDAFSKSRTLDELRTIASEDIKSHLYHVSTFQSLHDAASNISTSICHAATELKQLPSYDPTVFIIRLVVLLLTLLIFSSLIFYTHKTTRGKQRAQQNDTELDYYNLGVGGVPEASP